MSRLCEEYHHLSDSTPRFRIQRFRALFNGAEATSEDFPRLGPPSLCMLSQKTDVMFTIDDNHSSLFLHGSVDNWEINAGPQGPRTSFTNCSHFTYLPTHHRSDAVSFFEFFFDNDAKKSGLPTVTGRAHDAWGTPHQQAPSIMCQRHDVPVYVMWAFVHGTWLIPFARNIHPFAKEAGPGVVGGGKSFIAYFHGGLSFSLLSPFQ